MTRIPIDTSRFGERATRLPLDTDLGNWTFIIEDRPVRFFGSYAEACSQARLYFRLRDPSVRTIELRDREVVGRTHVGHIQAT